MRLQILFRTGKQVDGHILSHLQQIRKYYVYLFLIIFTYIHSISWCIMYDKTWHHYFLALLDEIHVPCRWDAPLRTRSASPRSWPLLTSWFKALQRFWMLLQPTHGLCHKAHLVPIVCTNTYKYLSISCIHTGFIMDLYRMFVCVLTLDSRLVFFRTAGTFEMPGWSLASTIACGSPSP